MCHRMHFLDLQQLDRWLNGCLNHNRRHISVSHKVKILRVCFPTGLREIAKQQTNLTVLHCQDNRNGIMWLVSMIIHARLPISTLRMRRWKRHEPQTACQQLLHAMLVSLVPRPLRWFQC